MIHSMICSLAGTLLLIFVVPAILKSWVDRWKVGRRAHFLTCIVWLIHYFQQLRAIPSVGHSGILTSYVGAIQYYRNTRDLVQEGYEKVGHTI